MKDNAPWLVILLTLSIAIVSMIITMRALKKDEPQVEGELFVKRSAVQDPVAATAEAPPPASAELPPQERVPEYSPPSAGATFGAAPPLGVSAAQPSPPTAPPVATQASGARPKNFHEMVMRERVKMRAVWDRHLEKSPMLKAYVKEWRSTPELMALKERWNKDHDPIGFLKALAGEPKFFQLLGKYGKSPELISILKDDMKVASPEALAAASKTLNTESVIKDLMNKVSGATGLPIGAWLGGKPTQEDVLKAVLNNPNLKNMPGNDPNRRR